MSPGSARTDCELQMMEAMVDCAYALGMAVGAAAKAEADSKKSFALYDLFHRSFLAVRMGIRLSLALRAGPKPVRPFVERDQSERDEAEAAESPERGDPVERERERDYEPVSLLKIGLNPFRRMGLILYQEGRAGYGRLEQRQFIDGQLVIRQNKGQWTIVVFQRVNSGY